MTSKMIVFVVCTVTVIGGLLIWLVKIRKARSENTRIFQSIAEAHVLSTKLDSIIATRNIDITGPSDLDSNLWKLATLAKWTAVQAVDRSESQGLDNDDRFVAMLIALVGAYYLTSGTSFSKEGVGSIACISLNAELFGAANSDGVDEAVRAFNKVAPYPQHGRTLLAIGNMITLFVAGNEHAQLTALGDLIDAIRGHVRLAE